MLNLGGDDGAHMLDSKRRFSWVIALAAATALALVACSGDSAEPAQQAAPQQTGAQAAPQEQQPAPAEQTPPEEPEEPAAAEQTEPPEVEEPGDADEGDDDGVVYDPDRDTLNEGERFGSRIESVDEVKQFRFTAEADEWLRISVDGLDGMDPVLTLLQPDRTDIARNDDRSATNRDSLLVVQIPTSGEQVIRVGAFDGASVGDFIIQVERLTIGNDADSGVVAIGTSTPARLNFPGDVDAFEFAGRAGQTVTLTVDGDTGVDVYMQFLDPTNTLIASDDDSGHGLDAELTLTLEQDGMHRIEVWTARNLEGQRPLIGSYDVIVRDGASVGLLDAQTATDTSGVALTFLDALRQGDSATILALAGPEALTTWGWQSSGDVDRDLRKMQSIGLGATVLQAVAQGDSLNENRARVFLQMAEEDWLRFELISVGGLWTVDFWAHQSFAPAGAAAAAAEAEQTEPEAEASDAESETEQAAEAAEESEE